MLSFNITKILGIFFLIIFLLVWGVVAVKSIVIGVKTGDWTPLLRNTGGKIFGIDSNLKNDVNLLLSKEVGSESYNKQALQVDILLNLIILFVIFVIIYKFGQWIGGNLQFSPIYDIFLILLILGIFMFIQFLYTWVVLDEIIIPFSGVWEVIIHFPTIFGLEGLFKV